MAKVVSVADIFSGYACRRTALHNELFSLRVIKRIIIILMLLAVLSLFVYAGDSGNGNFYGEFNVSECGGAASCTLSEYNTNDTSIATTLGAATSTGNVSFSNASIPTGSNYILQSARLRIRHGKTLTACGALGFKFFNRSGDTLCTINITAPADSDEYGEYAVFGCGIIDNQRQLNDLSANISASCTASNVWRIYFANISYSYDIFPALTTLFINSTFGTNTTRENLTAHAISTGEPETNISLVYDWRINGTSIADVNLPFNTNVTARDWVDDVVNNKTTLDYSSRPNNFTAWNVTAVYNNSAFPRGFYRFDGLTSFVMNNNSLYAYDTGYSFAFWMNKTRNSGTVIGKVYTGGGANVWGYNVRIGSGGTTEFQACSNGCSTATSSQMLQNNTWHHIAVVVNYTNVTFYIDGVADVQSIDINATYTPNYPITIGRRATPGVYFNGSLADVFLFNRTLTAQEVNLLYNNKTNMIASTELSKNQNVTVCVTPSDGYTEGFRNCSQGLMVLQSAPIINSVSINSSLGTNTSRENITAYVTATDQDGDVVRNIYDWRVNGTSIAILNMNFDVNNSNGTGKTNSYSTHQTNGTIINATWNATDGYNGTGAYRFQGVNSYIHMGNGSLSSFERTDNFSIVVWNKNAQATPTVFQPIVGRQLSSGSFPGYMLSITAAAQYQMSLRSNGGGHAIIRVNRTADTNWQHGAVVYYGNSSAYGIKAYVNGQPVTMEINTDTLASSIVTVAPLTIGARNDGGADGEYNGTIDNVMIFNRSLSQAEILALYNNRSDLIVSQELQRNQNWTVCVTPNDGIADGTTTCSAGLQVIDTCTPPSTNMNWTVAAEDTCVKANQVINLGTGQLKVTGAGFVKFVNTNITTKNYILQPSGGIARIILENSRLIRPMP